MMPVAKNCRGFLPRHLDRVLRDGGAQNIVQPGDAFDFFLSRRVGQDNGIVLVLSGKRQALRMQCRHNLARKIVHADDFSDRIFGAEQLFAHCSTDHAYVLERSTSSAEKMAPSSTYHRLMSK